MHPLESSQLLLCQAFFPSNFCRLSYCVFPVKKVNFCQKVYFSSLHNAAPPLFPVTPLCLICVSNQHRQQHLQQTSHHQCFRLWSAGRFDIFWANGLQIDLFLALISFWNADESHVLSAGELFSAALCLSGWKVFHHRRRVDANLIWVRGEKPQPANVKENSADLHIHLPASWLWRLPGQPFRIRRPSH